MIHFILDVLNAWCVWEFVLYAIYNYYVLNAWCVCYVSFLYVILIICAHKLTHVHTNCNCLHKNSLDSRIIIDPNRSQKIEQQAKSNVDMPWNAEVRRYGLQPRCFPGCLGFRLVCWYQASTLCGDLLLRRARCLAAIFAWAKVFLQTFLRVRFHDQYLSRPFASLQYFLDAGVLRAFHEHLTWQWNGLSASWGHCYEVPLRFGTCFLISSSSKYILESYWIFFKF